MNAHLRVTHARIQPEHSLNDAYLGATLERLNVAVQTVNLPKVLASAERDCQLQQYAHHLQRALQVSPSEVVLSTNSLAVAGLETDVPIVLWTNGPCGCGALPDQPPADYHVERRAVRRAALLIYSSHWAARSAIQYFGADPARVYVLPFGVNLQPTPSTGSLQCLVDARLRRDCRLLWLEADWEGKGGRIPLETLDALSARGINATLTTIGNDPPDWWLADPRVSHLGALDRRDPTERALMNEALSNAHYLILPRDAEYTPTLIGEANAFGLPALAPEVGGVGSLLTDGINGFLLPRGSSGAAYAGRIALNLAQPRGYETLALSARHEFDTRLSWSASAHRLKALLQAVVRASAASREVLRSRTAEENQALTRQGQVSSLRPGFKRSARDTRSSSTPLLITPRFG